MSIPTIFQTHSELFTGLSKVSQKIIYVLIAAVKAGPLNVWNSTYRNRHPTVRFC